MIRRIFYSIFLQNEQFGYYSRVNEEVQLANLEELQIAAFADDLDKQVDRATLAVNRLRSDNLTETLNKQDKKQRGAFVAFRNYTKAATHHTDSVIAEAAKKMCKIIRSHNWSLQTRGIKHFASKMESLITEVKREENMQDLLTIDCLVWFTNMVGEYDKYTILYHKRVESKSSKKDYDMKEVFKSLRGAADELFLIIEALYKINGTEGYITLAEKISVITDEYMTMVRARRTRKGSDENETNDIIDENKKDCKC